MVLTAQRQMNARIFEPVTVEELRSLVEFSRIESEWNDLVVRLDDQIFYRHEFIATWLENFAKQQARILLLRDRHRRLVGALPLIARRTSVCGVPVRLLNSASNSHSGRFDILADQPAVAAGVVLDYLHASKGWDLLVLAELSESEVGEALLAAAVARSMHIGRWRAADSPFLELPDQWEALATRLSRGYRAGLRRKRRNLTKLGRLSVQRLGLDRAFLTRGMQLEASGWKGRAGTAMAQQSATQGFYLQLAERMQALGCLVLWGLWLDQRLLAFQYGLEYRGRYSLLKVAYDESFSRFSPGQLLMEDVLRDAIGRHLRSFDFLGDMMEWKGAWRPVLRCQQWLYIFQDTTMGQLAHRAKFRLLPTWQKLRQRR